MLLVKQFFEDNKEHVLEIRRIYRQENRESIREAARLNSQKEENKKKLKPPFRTEEDLAEYAKPMNDEHQSRAEFEDTEWD